MSEIINGYEVIDGFRLRDNDLGLFGYNGDGVITLRSATLNANTALTGVIVGTPVTPALAANSLIIGNITTDGDILIVGSDGGHSRTALFFDASAPASTLYNVGGTWTAGATTWTIPAVTLGGDLTTGGYSFGAGAGSVQINSTGSWTGLTFQQTEDGDSAVQFMGRKVSASPVVNDIIAMFTAYGKSDGSPQNDIYYGNLAFQIESPTKGAETGRMRLQLSVAGVTANRLTLSSAGVLNIPVSTGVLQINTVQVVGARVVDARCDDTINSGDATTDGVIDSLRDAMITHGLIAAA